MLFCKKKSKDDGVLVRKESTFTPKPYIDQNLAWRYTVIENYPTEPNQSLQLKQKHT